MPAQDGPQSTYSHPSPATHPEEAHPSTPPRDGPSGSNDLPPLPGNHQSPPNSDQMPPRAIPGNLPPPQSGAGSPNPPVDPTIPSSTSATSNKLPPREPSGNVSLPQTSDGPANQPSDNTVPSPESHPPSPPVASSSIPFPSANKPPAQDSPPSQGLPPIGGYTMSGTQPHAQDGNNPQPTQPEGPEPSAVHHHTRLRRAAEALLQSRIAHPHCPPDMRACPSRKAASAGYLQNVFHTVLAGQENWECMDMNELLSCGGCTSDGTGQDCTQISGVDGVGCESDRCTICTYNLFPLSIIL